MKKPANALVITYVVIDHTYMFRSPSATILRVYSIKEYNKKLCVANLFKVWIYKMFSSNHDKTNDYVFQVVKTQPLYGEFTQPIQQEILRTKTPWPKNAF